MTSPSRASDKLSNSISPDEDLSVLLGNILTHLGLGEPWVVKRFSTSSASKLGGVLKKWRIFEGGWMRFLEAISGLMNRLFFDPIKSWKLGVPSGSW